MVRDSGLRKPECFLEIAHASLAALVGRDDRQQPQPYGVGQGLEQRRDLLGLRTQIIGVVAAGAPAYALSFAAGRVVSTETAISVNQT